MGQGGEGNVDHGSRRTARSPLGRREEPIHRQPLQRRVGPKATGCLNQIGQALPPLQLVHRGPHHRARQIHPRAVHRHEDHVARLEPDVVARLAPQQIVVQIERRHRLAGALHHDVAHVGPLGHAPCRVQRRERGAERADLVRPRLRYLAHHVDLIGPYVGNRNIESRGGTGPALHARVHPAQPDVQHVAQLIERQVGHEHLAHLRNQNESLARHRQRVGQLHVAREDQDQLIARAQLVVGRHRTREQREELRGRAAEHVHPEHPARGTRPPRPDEPAVHRQVALLHRQAERLDGGQLERSGNRRPLARRGATEIGVEQVRRIAARRQPRPHLLGREPRLQQPLADHVRKPRVLLHGLLQGRWRLRGRGDLGGGGRGDAEQAPHQKGARCAVRGCVR